MNSKGRFGWILQSTCNAVEVPIRSLYTLLLHVNPILLLGAAIESTVQAVPHGCSHFLMELMKREKLIKRTKKWISILISNLWNSAFWHLFLLLFSNQFEESKEEITTFPLHLLAPQILRKIAVKKKQQIFFYLKINLILAKLTIQDHMHRILEGTFWYRTTLIKNYMIFNKFFKI